MNLLPEKRPDSHGSLAPLTAGINENDLRLLLESFFTDLTAKTLKVYSEAFKHFSKFIGAETELAAIHTLLNGGHLQANVLVARYKKALIEANYAAHSINVRLSAIRSMVKMANRLGKVPWLLSVKGVHAVAYKDTRGPDSDGVEALMKAAQEQKNKAIAARDVSVIGLMFYCGLRKNEIRQLNISDLNLDAQKVSILRKGYAEKIVRSIPDTCCEALKTWLAHTKFKEGAVFVAVQTGNRLAENSIWKIITELSKKASIGHVYPHKLRHSAINEAFEQEPDIRKVQQFSGHKDLKTLTIYDDHRTDAAGEISQKIADKFKKRKGENPGS